MVIPDVNVLVAAFMSGHPHHEVAQTWLHQSLADEAQIVVVPDLVWVGFIQVITNKRIFEHPASIEAAAGFVIAVTQRPTYDDYSGLTGGIDQLLRLCDQAQMVGGQVLDAYIAVVAMQLGATVATFDNDFRRHRKLKVIDLNKR